MRPHFGAFIIGRTLTVVDKCPVELEAMGDRPRCDDIGTIRRAKGDETKVVLQSFIDDCGGEDAGIDATAETQVPILQRQLGNAP